MKSRINSASIVCEDEFAIRYRICRLDYEEWEDGSFEYRFTPDYRALDILTERVTGGIPGLNLDLRREVYIRKDMEPVFMTERSPSRNRVDVRQLMEDVGLDHYDRLEWLIRTDTRYAGDSLYCIRYEEPVPATFRSDRGRAMSRNVREILAAVGRGSPILIDGKELTFDETVAVARSLRMMLAAERKVFGDGKDPLPVGRRKKTVDRQTVEWAYSAMKNGTAADEIASQIGISRATLYRRMNEFGYRGRINGR